MAVGAPIVSQPSMLEAAKIRDVAARHAYVFDNGLCSPDFFDVEKRGQSEEFCLAPERIQPHDKVLEIGCFTGLNLINLRLRGHTGELKGIEFVSGALEWLADHDPSPRESFIEKWPGYFPDEFP